MMLGLGLQINKLRRAEGGGGSNAFIIEVDTTNTGTSNNDQFQFTGAEGDYNVVAKQSNIVVATFNNLSGEETITLSSSGIYVLEVTAKSVNGFNRIQFSNSGDKLKIIDVKQWGNIVWSSFENIFLLCNNLLITATDKPNLSNISNFQSAMRGTSLNPYVANWDVSNVTNMNFMFLSAISANPDARNWNVSNVTTMLRMFNGSNLSTDNLAAIYENWSQLSLQQNIDFNVGTTKYNASGATGRQKLIDDFNWTITDGGEV